MKYRLYVDEDGNPIVVEHDDTIVIRLRGEAVDISGEEAYEILKDKLDKKHPIVQLYGKKDNKGVDKKEKKDGNSTIHKTSNE